MMRIEEEAYPPQLFVPAAVVVDPHVAWVAVVDAGLAAVAAVLFASVVVADAAAYQMTQQLHYRSHPAGEVELLP